MWVKRQREDVRWMNCAEMSRTRAMHWSCASIRWLGAPVERRPLASFNTKAWRALSAEKTKDESKARRYGRSNIRATFLIIAPFEFLRRRQRSVARRLNWSIGRVGGAACSSCRSPAPTCSPSSSSSPLRSPSSPSSRLPPPGLKFVTKSPILEMV